MKREQEQPDLIAANSTPLSDSFLKSAVPHWLLTLAALLLAAGLYGLSRFNYLLFHILVEMFFVTVSFTVFSIGWNARRFVRNNSLMLLAVAFAVIGSIELLHAIAYRGMGIFPAISTDIATQLWIIARFLEAVTFIAVASLLNYKKPLSPWLLLGASVILGLLALSTVWPLDIFPTCYAEPGGLTRFKIGSEHFISILFAISILIFWKNREALHLRLLKLLSGSLVFSILASLAFTLYSDIYGITNFLGHFFKFISVTLIYRSLVIGTLRTPYATLFRDMQQAKESLDLELVHRRKTEAELRAANRELDAFVRTVSHDLRSPLTPIIALPELLLDQLGERLDDNAVKALHDIRNQGLRMARILEDLLVFARAGRLIDGVASSDIGEILQNVLEDLGSRIIASGCRVEVLDLPAVAYPRTALFQVFSNLIGNAVKYAGQEGSPIEVGGALEEDAVVLYVRDHGSGIPAEAREKIFDVFYRGDAADDSGSGIGLATVLKIARCLDGDAWVETTPGGGATFKVRLAKPEPDRQQSLDFNIP